MKKQKQKGEIIFRRIDADHPAYWTPKAHWYVEWWPECDWVAPYGTAYVLVGPGFTFLEMMLVNPLYQRQGVATELYHACLERWPNLDATDAVSKAGKAWLAALEKKGILPNPNVDIDEE